MIKTRVIHAPRIWAGIRSVMINNHFFNDSSFLYLNLSHHRCRDRKLTDVQILDTDKALHFSLLRLQLVELIRGCTTTGSDISPVLKFATEQLGPRAPTNPKFLEELEKTMALLLFPPETLEPQLAALLDPELRRDAADSVNRAILERQSTRREAAIRQLVKMRAWAESTARERGVSLPERLDVGLSADDADRRHHSENGHEPMVTV